MYTFWLSTKDVNRLQLRGVVVSSNPFHIVVIRPTNKKGEHMEGARSNKWIKPSSRWILLLILIIPIALFLCMQNLQLSDFTLVKQLGEGGFGSAYLAVHNPTQEKVCLKFITLTGDRSSLQSADEEGKTLSQLEDEHIIKYYGSFVEGDQFCIAMEYAPGGSLYDVITVWTSFCFIKVCFRIIKRLK